jgi:hypothetical protein
MFICHDYYHHKIYTTFNFLMVLINLVLHHEYYLISLAFLNLVIPFISYNKYYNFK